jgi:autonomous glycyl radical cofactor GrcA
LINEGFGCRLDDMSHGPGRKKREPEDDKRQREHPEKHRDLFVRVSGYSAEFIGLSEIAQDEIISRTEFEMRS